MNELLPLFPKEGPGEITDNKFSNPPIPPFPHSGGFAEEKEKGEAIEFVL